jgi:hypothetical protein
MTLTAAMSVLRFRAIAKHSQDLCKKCHRHLGGVCRCTYICPRKEINRLFTFIAIKTMVFVIIAEHGAATNLVYVLLQEQLFALICAAGKTLNQGSKRNIHKHQSN